LNDKIKKNIKSKEKIWKMELKKKLLHCLHE
jgi:hypothetical protein